MHSNIENPFKKISKKIFLLFTLLFLQLYGFSQTDSSKYNLGVNLAPLYSGSPELLFDYYFNKRIGASFNFGTTFVPRGAFIKVGEDLKRKELKGNYFKVGLKLRLPIRGSSSVVPFAQLFYVGSSYYERATKPNGTILDPNAPDIEIKRSGYVNAIAFTLGMDLKIIKRLEARLGVQSGFYDRDDHLGKPSLTLQPGLGAAAFLGSNQLLLALCFKFGSIN